MLLECGNVIFGLFEPHQLVCVLWEQVKVKEIVLVNMFSLLQFIKYFEQ